VRKTSVTILLPENVRGRGAFSRGRIHFRAFAIVLFFNRAATFAAEKQTQIFRKFSRAPRPVYFFAAC
jgi:hypothetical protein